jgi:hypothetical protein
MAFGISSRARFVAAAVALGSCSFVATAFEATADARAVAESHYGFDRTWNTAIRLVRVDLGFAVTEKDPDTGYLLFEYKSSEGGSKSTPGSMEVVRPTDPDAPVRVIVTLPRMPRYHEQVLADSLLRKLRDEFGEPIRRPKPAPRRVDAGSDGGNDNEGESGS